MPESTHAKQITAPVPALRHRMKYWLATFLFASTSTAYAESVLYSGADLPSGWVNGFTYSLQTRTECQRLFDQIANDEPGKAMLKCMSRVDPKAPATDVVNDQARPGASHP
jgi:hypothetical protein